MHKTNSIMHDRMKTLYDIFCNIKCDKGFVSRMMDLIRDIMEGLWGSMKHIYELYMDKTIRII